MRPRRLKKDTNANITYEWPLEPDTHNGNYFHIYLQAWIDFTTT